LILRETLGNEARKGDDMGASSFNSVPKAFFTLYHCVVVGDCADKSGRPIFVLVAEEYGWVYGMIYALTFLFMTVGLYNVIVAVYVENTLAAAKCNELKIKEARDRDYGVFREKSLEMAMLIYSNINSVSIVKLLQDEVPWPQICNMEVSHKQFSEICQDQNFCDLLAELDIAPENQGDLFDTLDSDRGGTLDITEIIDGISKLRGNPKKSDVISVLLSVRHVTELLNETLMILDEHTEALNELGMLETRLVQRLSRPQSASPI